MRRTLIALAMLAAGVARAEYDPRPITTTELLALMGGAPADRWSFTLVDARTEVEFAEAHIPGAALVRAKETAAVLPKLVADKRRLVVFYCNGPNCTKTRKAGKAAYDAGYTNIREYNEGLPGWGQARQRIEGKPYPAVETPPIAPAALKALAGKDAPLLVDIRDSDEFKAFHIAGARSVPIDEITKRVKELPPGRICIVDHAGHQTPVAGRLLTALGRRDLLRLDGGMIAWQSAGLPVEK